MSSSISSKRAFSHGGITISKRRNRLKGDIVEALQCLMCTIQHDLLFWELAPSSRLEAGLADSEDDMEETTGWDEMLTDNENDIQMDIVIESD